MEVSLAGRLAHDAALFEEVVGVAAAQDLARARLQVNLKPLTEPAAVVVAQCLRVPECLCSAGKTGAERGRSQNGDRRAHNFLIKW